MKILAIIRHSKSSWKHIDRCDFERPLSSRGKSDASALAEIIAEKDFGLECIMTSPARRARKTARKISDRLGFYRDSIIEDMRIYEGDVKILSDLISLLPPEISRVALVGHNPVMHELSERCLGKHIDKFRTSGLIVLEFPCNSWVEIPGTKGRIIYSNLHERNDLNAD